MALEAKRSALKVPIRLMEMIVSNGISGCGPLEPATFCAQPVPAQQTAMRRGPAAAAASTAARTWASSRTSQDASSRPSSEASAAPFSALTSAIVTSAPRACRRRTVASPSPEAPPTAIAEEPSISMCARLSRGATRQRQREQPVRVGQPAHQLQSGGRQVPVDAFGRELGADLRAQLLAGVEVHRQVQPAHRRDQLALGAQAHLDPLVLLVEQRHVVEVLGVEAVSYTH